MFIVLCVLIAVLLSLIHWVNMLRDMKRIGVPGPMPLPILAHAHLIAGPSSRFLRQLTRFVEKFDKSFVLYILGQRYIGLSHPCYIEPIMSSTDYITKGVSYYYLQPWLGQGLLTAGGNRWRTHRKFLTPAFHFNILQNFLPVFCKNSKILTEKLKILAEADKDFDLFPVIALAALDNVTESIMGVSVNAQQNERSEYVQAIEVISKIVSERMRNPVLSDVVMNFLPHKRWQDKALKVLHGQTSRVIEARRKELEKLNITSLNHNSEIGIKNKYAFLDLLLLAQIDGQKIDDTHVREEVDTFMFEGHDTTTSGIVFALYCLSLHEDVQNKVVAELVSIFGDDMDRDPTDSELKQMKYMECVIKESLRLYPPVPLVERFITEDTNLDGLFIPKNTAVVIAIMHMQRRADMFEDPLEFRPERFSGNYEAQNPFSWLAFSAGPRNCIGQKFAMMELKVTLAAIVRKYRILPSGHEPSLCADLILRSENGVRVKLAPR